jgi:hypothetical protein
VEYPLGAVTDRLEVAIPKVFGGLTDRWSHPDDPRIQYAFEARRGPLEAEIRQDTFHLNTTVRYGAQVWASTPFGVELNASCGASSDGMTDDAPRAHISASAPLLLEADWDLDSEIRVDLVEPLTPGDRCLASALTLQLDATEPILEEIQRQLQLEADRFAAILRSTAVRPVAEAEWERVRTPITLGSDTWLLLNPVGIDRVQGVGSGASGRMVQGRFLLHMRPRVVVGSEPVVSDAPLPPLGTVPPGDNPPILLDGRIGYQWLAERSLEALGGQDLQVAGRALRVRSLSLAGTTDGRIEGNIGVEGALDGRILFSGTPVLVEGGTRIEMPDLSLRVESENPLVQVAFWLFRDRLANLIRLRTDDQIERSLSSLGEQLGETSFVLSDRVELTAMLDEARLTDVRADSSALAIRLQLRPEATVRMR